MNLWAWHVATRAMTICLILALGLLGLACGANRPPDPPTVTAALLPSPTATSVPTLTSTATPTVTAIPSETATDTATATSTVTLPPTHTPVPVTPIPTNTPGRSARIPILMFHHIAIPPPDADTVRIDLSVLPSTFEEEVNYLSDHGFHTVRLVDLVAFLKGNVALPPKPIALTFDDGYDDNYQSAFPALKARGFIGTFFIISGRADNAVPGYMTWPQIEEMAASGMEIGSHSFDHRFNLGAMPAAIQWAEIKPSHDAILQHFPDSAPVFAYPSGSYNALTVSLLEQLGYVAAATTRQGTLQFADDPLELSRIRIRGEWSSADFVSWFRYWTGGE